MLRKTMLSVVAVVLIVSVVLEPTDTLKIYSSLTHCYRGNNTDYWIGSSLQNLLELIRKIEDAHPTSIDMRMLAVSIIHRLRIDGIQKAPGIQETEYTIPYGVNGIMAPKYQLLLSLISDSPSAINYTEALTPLELCTLHRLVSSTVEPYQRGDESKTCSPSYETNLDLEGARCPIENKVKIFPNGKMLVVPGDVSSCPEELGVVRTFGYGSFAPGVVIGSIAAGLQPQAVEIRELYSEIKANSNNHLERRDVDKMTKISSSLSKVDNVFASGLAGDLAEVCIYQAPYYGENVSVGLTGYWDNMHFPKRRYLIKDHYKLWQLTDSEILAGIDGYHLATQINSWVQRIQTLRLSQVLEMYYSVRGIPTASIENVNRRKRPTDVNTPPTDLHTSVTFSSPDPMDSHHQDSPSINLRVEKSFQQYQPSYYDPKRYSLDDSLDSACERTKILERISRLSLREQTYNLAQILQLTVPVITVNDELLEAACSSAVDRFFEYAKGLLARLPSCGNSPTSYRRANIDLTMILDGSRDEYESQKLISVISEQVDVSKYGSYISVIHGGSSELLVSRTNSILRAFEELRYYEGKYPISFSLSTSLSKVVQLFSDYDRDPSRNFTICERSRVVLIVSQTQRIKEDDFRNAEWLFTGSLQQFPDVYYVFVTNDHKSFEDLSRNVSRSSYVLPNQYTILDSSDLEPVTFLNRFVAVVRQIPKRLIVPTCQDAAEANPNSNSNLRFNEYEDYVSPHQANNYQINPMYLQNVHELRVQFEGVGYGSLSICMIHGSMQCQTTSNTEKVQFNVSQPCQTGDQKSCSSIKFTVELDVSNMRCTETDCRYPDQVRFLITVENTECRTGAANHSFNCAVSLLVVLVLSLLHF